MNSNKKLQNGQVRLIKNNEYFEKYFIFMKGFEKAMYANCVYNNKKFLPNHNQVQRWHDEYYKTFMARKFLYSLN